MLCALVRNGIVIEVKDITEEEFPTIVSSYDSVVEVTNNNPMPAENWTFTGTTFSPPAGVNATPTLKISKLAFLQRFTDIELATIEAAAAENNQYGFALRVALRKQSVATYIDLSLPETISGVNSLAALQLITSQRATTILTTPPTEAEKYRG